MHPCVCLFFWLLALRQQIVEKNWNSKRDAIVRMGRGSGRLSAFDVKCC